MQLFNFIYFLFLLTHVVNLYIGFKVIASVVVPATLILYAGKVTETEKFESIDVFNTTDEAYIMYNTVHKETFVLMNFINS